MNAMKAFALTALLVPALAIPAFAAPAGQGDGPRNKKERPLMTQEQRGKYAALWEEHDAKMTPLRTKLQDKFLELEAIEQLSGTTREDVTKLIAEISALRTQLHAERQDFQDRLEKEGLPFFGRHGYGMGRGHGMGHGYGKGHGMGRGMGHGCPMMGDYGDR